MPSSDPNPLPSIDVLMSLFRYDQATGALYWRYRSISSFKSVRDAEAWNSRYCNTEAGSNLKGYMRISIAGYGRFLTHRIIYKIASGGKDPDLIDHIDGNPSNNLLHNIRSVDHGENSRNSSISNINTSGVRGVCWDKKSRKWRATITFHRKFKHIGHYDTLESAVAARKSMEHDLGFHPNHGRPSTS